MYFIISSITKQNDSDYFLIKKKDGKILEFRRDVGIYIDEDNKSFTVVSCNGSIAVDTECSYEVKYILKSDISN